MATEIASAFVALVPSFKGGQGAITRELSGAGAKAGDQAGKETGRRLSGGILGSLKGMAGPIAGVFAGLGVLNFLRNSASAAEEANSVARVSNAIIKSTGGVANVTAGNLDKLTASLMRKTAVDDDEIRKGANLLLTFKNVRNEVGRGNDIFNRATASALDLSKAGFGSLDSTSKQLGKALNDPIKGITALSRAGVTFTDGQKKQIEAMVESGNVLGAQKVILKEVESQVGGTAAASATASQKIAAMWGEIQESVGTAVLPLIESLVPVFEDLAPLVERGLGAIAPHLAKVGPFLKTLVGGFQSLFSGLGGGGVGSGLLSFFGSLRSAFDTVAPAVGKFVSTLLPPLQKIGRQMMAVVGPALRDFGNIIKTQVAPAVAAFLPVVAPVAKFLIEILGGAVVGALKGAVSVIKGVFQVLAGLLNVFAGLFTGDWSRLWKGVQQIGQGLWDAIKGAFQIFINVGIGKVFGLAAKGILKVGSKLWSGLVGLFKRGGRAVSNTNTAIINAVVGFFRALPGRIGRALASLGRFLLRPWVQGFQSARRAITNGISNAIDLVRSIPGRAGRALSSIGRALRNAGGRLIDGLVRGIRNKIGQVQDAVGDVMAAARRLLPFSPAKEGPFSGKGWTLYSGRAISEALAKGMTQRTGTVAAASARLAASAYPNVAGVGTPGGGGLTTPITKVYIGDRELTQIVRVEVGESNRGIRRQVMAGARGWA